METAPRTPGRSGPAAPRPAASPAALRLAERLRELGAGAAALEELLEPALRAVLEATKANAGALCLFDQRHELLRLAVEVGLSDEGCQQLRLVRRGGMNGWDMPLHGLLNRRVYLIERASRNRYVPPLVEAAASVTTIGCVPLYAAALPVASMVLVTLAPNRLTEQQIGPIDQPLRELARIIETARRRCVAAPESPAPVTAPRGTSARGPSDGAQPHAEAASFAEAERERARLATALHAAATERAEEARRQAAVDAADAVERAGEVKRLMARVAEAEGAAERERERVTASERERQQLAALLEDAAARERRVQEELRAASERLSAHDDEVRRALAAAQAAEEARAAADAEAASAREALARAEAAVAALEEEKRRARDEIERLREEGAALLTERARLGKGLEEARVREAEARVQVADLERRMAALRDERHADAAARATELEQLEARLVEAEAAAAHRHERVDEWQRDRDRLAAELHEAAAREQRAQEELRAATERAAAAAEGDLRRALDAARTAEEAQAAARADADGARAALARAEAAVRELEGERREAQAEIERLQAAANDLLAERERLGRGLAETRAHEEQARTRLAEAEREAIALREAHEREVAALGGRLEASIAERERLRAALEAVEAERDALAADEAAADAAHARLEEAVVRDAARAGRAASETTAPAAAPEPALAGRLIVLDDDRTWESAGGGKVRVVRPTERGIESAVGTGGEPILVNLAAPHALSALATLRAAGSSARFWGCIAQAGAGRAIPLGPVEPVVRPVDPDAVLATLEPYAARDTRVLAVGSDADALISLRQALVREGMVVWLAWDTMRATELLATLRLEIVVVDLSLPNGTAYPFLARLSACEPRPMVALVPDERDNEGLAGALADPNTLAHSVPIRELLASIATS